MKIIKVRKNQDGDITNVMNTNEEILSLNKIVALAKIGQVESVRVEKNENGVETIVSTEKCEPKDILDNLPQF
ncbi:DUF3892 domain-containing protein [Clostridium sp. DL1XJH146]